MGDNAALENFEKRLDDIQARYETWLMPILKMRREKSMQINRNGYTLQDYTREIEQLTKEQEAVYNPYEASSAVYEELCPYYLSADSEQRIAIRAMLRKRPFWAREAAFAYMEKMAHELKETGDVKKLRMGVAAASIEDFSSDFRDTVTHLAELYVFAERAGLDAKTEFAEIAALSNEEKAASGMSAMKQVLSNFQNSSAAIEQRKHESREAMLKNMFPGMM